MKCVAVSFTWLLPLLQSAPSHPPAAAGARLAAKQRPRDMSSTFGGMRIKRPIEVFALILRWRLRPSVTVQGSSSLLIFLRNNFAKKQDAAGSCRFIH